MKKILNNYRFKNRITQEPKQILDALRSTHINMNYHKKQDKNTIDGLFMITLQPNCKVHGSTLERTFKSILSFYYRWRYGTKWRKIKNLQQEFVGVIEQQIGQHNHIHFILYQTNMEELSIFLGYIETQFKKFYPKASFDFQRVYKQDKAIDYCSYISSKDAFLSKRRNFVVPICTSIFQPQKMKRLRF